MRRLVSFGVLRNFAAALALASVGQSVQAGPILFVTPTDVKTDAGVAVKASASFTFEENHLIVTLNNLFQNPESQFQLLSSLSFHVVDGKYDGNLETKNYGNITKIADDGTYSEGVSDPLSSWTASSTDSIISLTSFTKGTASEMIIGPDSEGFLDPSMKGLYSSADSSFSQNNPYVLGSATFDITLEGVAKDSMIDKVMFQFGPKQEIGFVDGQFVDSPDPSPVPEPSSIILFGLGAVGLIFRSKFRKPTPA